ncbi:unnamed protein product [Dibothriocephalus latus]|uniref:PDZ domain-containing protein n=1 Tax=Dibothriocephalus latus TaxID=60516 RepID=A0A3P7P0S4_DIBLA|nr:unnamed protein product [Dibothriocephalus latus]
MSEVLLYNSFEALKIVELLNQQPEMQNIGSGDILDLLDVYITTTSEAYLRQLCLTRVSQNGESPVFRSRRPLSVPADQLRSNPAIEMVFYRQPDIVTTGIKFDPCKPSGLTSAVTVKRNQSDKFGIQIGRLNGGIYISYVRKDSPAARAGLRFTDQITHIDEQPVTGCEIPEVLEMLRSKQTCKITKKDR